MTRAGFLWGAFLAVWGLAQFEWSDVRPGMAAGAAAALAALHLAAMRLLPEPLRLSRGAKLFLLGAAGVFALQLLPLAPILFPHTEALRRTHGVGSLWPGTADAERTAVALTQVAAYALSALLVLRLRAAGLSSSAVLKGVCAVLVLQGLYALGQAVFGFRELPFGRERVLMDSASGTLANRNSFAGLMAMGLSAAVALAFRSLYYGRHERDRGLVWSRRIEAGLFWGLVAALFALDIVLSRSRGGALSALAALGVFAFLARGRTGGAAAGIVGALLAGAVLLASPGALVERFRQLDPHEIASDARWEYWRTTAAAALRQPVLGFGVGTHRWAYHPFQPATVPGQIEHAHNEYVNVFFEGGAAWLIVLGAGLAAWFVRAGTRLRGLAGPDRVPVVAAIAAVAAMAVHSLVDFDLRITPVGMLFAVMVALGASRSGATSGARAFAWGAPVVGLAAAAAVLLLPLHPEPRADEALCRRVLGLSPYDYRAAWYYGRAAQARGDLAEADRRIGVAADLWPAHPDLQREAGLWFWEKHVETGDRGDLLRAGRCLSRLFAQRPGAVDAVMGEIWDEARPVADYEALLPGTPASAAELGAVLARRGRWREGMEAFERGCPARAENAGPYDHFAAALGAMGQWGLEARVREARLSVKSDAAAYGAAAQAWQRLGALGRALERAGVACRIDPSRADWPALRGSVLAAKGEKLAASEAYGEAIRLAPRDLSHRLARAGLYYELAMHSPAAADFREVLRSRPHDRSAVLGLARSLIGGGEAAAARAMLDSFLASNPDDIDAKNLRSSLR